ncbi:MAG: HAMP domain-containing sensor histidine kinase [bacterium]
MKKEQILALRQENTVLSQENERLRKIIIEEEENFSLVIADYKKAIEEKNKFFSLIAHDLRGPVGGVRSLVEILMENINVMPMKEIEDVLGAMYRSSVNTFDLVMNLLDWGRTQGGLMVLEKYSFVLFPKVLKALESITELANKKNIKIIIDIPKSEIVLADKNIFSSIVRNLVSNAVKFTSTGGQVLVSAKSLPGFFVEISIQDNGIGMNGEIISNLFTINKSTSRSGTEGEPSTGLGLMLCKDFVEKNGGKIWVESEEGVGSTFFFTLPKG